MDQRRPILVVGLPRSGTTWTARILSSADGARAVIEPDNEKVSSPAVSAKRALGRFPYLAPGEDDSAYRRLWEWAVSGARRTFGVRLGDRLLRSTHEDELEDLASGRESTRVKIAASLGALRGSTQGPAGARTLVKSVHSCLCVEWLASVFDLEVVVVRRHPAAVLTSWLELGLKDADRRLDERREVVDRLCESLDLPPAGPSHLERAVWQLGLLSSVLESARVRHPEWHLKDHEALCRDPAREFERLFTKLGLSWSAPAAAALARHDRAGSAFSIDRDASQAAGSWRSKIAERELSVLDSVLGDFPFQQWWRTETAPDFEPSAVPGPSAVPEPSAVPTPSLTD